MVPISTAEAKGRTCLLEPCLWLAPQSAPFSKISTHDCSKQILAYSRGTSSLELTIAPRGSIVTSYVRSAQNCRVFPYGGIKSTELYDSDASRSRLGMRSKLSDHPISTIIPLPWIGSNALCLLFNTKISPAIACVGDERSTRGSHTLRGTRLAMWLRLAPNNSSYQRLFR